MVLRVRLILRNDFGIQSLHPIQWSYVGFGWCIAELSGCHQFGEGYDPRLRPWYIEGQTHGTTLRRALP